MGGVARHSAPPAQVQPASPPAPVALAGAAAGRSARYRRGRSGGEPKIRRRHLDEPGRRRRDVLRPHRPLRQHVDLDDAAHLRPGHPRRPRRHSAWKPAWPRPGRPATTDLTYTFHLRQTNFHDGTPCTSDGRRLLPRARALDGSLRLVVPLWRGRHGRGHRPADGGRHAEQPWAPFEADLALYGASIFPKAAFDAQGDELWEHPIGTGAYMFDSWEKRCPDRPQEEPDLLGRGQAVSGRADLQGPDRLQRPRPPTPGRRAGHRHRRPLQPDRAAQRRTPSTSSFPDAVARIDYIALNLLRPPFDDKNLRQAINYAVDKDAIIQNVLFGAGTAGQHSTCR